jgi:hypothetical protein
MEGPEVEQEFPPEDAPEQLRKNLRRVEVMYGLMLKLVWEIGDDLSQAPERGQLREILDVWLARADANLAMIVSEESGFDEPWVRCSNCDTMQPFSECFDGYVEDADHFSCKACDHSWVASRAVTGLTG